MLDVQDVASKQVHGDGPMYMAVSADKGMPEILQALQDAFNMQENDRGTVSQLLLPVCYCGQDSHD